MDPNDPFMLARRLAAARFMTARPHPVRVAAASGAVACGAALALGVGATMLGTVFNGCEQFGDFGCGGYFMTGVFAAPFSGAGGALVGGLGAAWVERKRPLAGGADVWRRCLGLVALLVVVPTLLFFLVRAGGG